jgi:hypothetical protein
MVEPGSYRYVLASHLGRYRSPVRGPRNAQGGVHEAGVGEMHPAHPAGISPQRR